MKKQLHIKLIISLCFLLLLSVNLQAQGEWQWARSYSGQDDNMNGGLYNQITRSVFDSQGNIYIAGTMGENALLDNDENLSEGSMMGFSAAFIAKLDPQGNLLWKKSIKNSNYDSYTNWMDIVGDTSIVLFANSTSPGGNNSMLWYLDTLIIGQYPNPPTYPLGGGQFSCFTTFDLNGNKQSEYFLRKRYYNLQGTLIGGDIAFDKLAPFYIDKNGYIYLYANISKPSDADTIRIVINDQKVFPLGDFSIQSNAWLLKFTPNFDLVWSKQIVRDTSGRGNEDSLLSWFRPYPTGITVDEDENLYLTGHIEHTRSDDTSYYREVHLGSGKKLILNDAGCRDLGFIIKYDTTGEPIWANQVFGQKKNIPNTSTSSSYFTFISTSTINKDDNNVYILGYGFHSLTYILNGQLVYDSTICKLYFDDTTQLRFEIDTSTGTPYANGIFFAKLNKETGRYISNGVTRGSAKNLNKKEVSFVARNNQVIRKIIYTHHLKGIDTIYYTGGIIKPGFAIVRWKDDGELIDVLNIPVFSDPGKTEDGNTIMNDNGDLFITGMYSTEITFGDIVLNGSSRSNAFMAKYHDSTFVHTYVEDTSSLLREISIEGKGITVYPNPTKGDVYITTQGEKINSFSLYNINGQLLLKSEKLKTTSEKLNLSAFSKGVYIIKIITDKNVYSKKIIVN